MKNHIRVLDIICPPTECLEEIINEVLESNDLLISVAHLDPNYGKGKWTFLVIICTNVSKPKITYNNG